MTQLLVTALIKLGATPADAYQDDISPETRSNTLDNYGY